MEDRQHAVLRGMLSDGGRPREASVLDISSRGLMVWASPAPPRGTMVEIRVGRHALVGQVQWAEARRFGVRLRDRIDVLAVIGNEAGPTTLKAARAARGKPSVEAKLAFSRHFARGFTLGIFIAAVAGGATFAAHAVSQSLAPLIRVERVLGGN